MSASRSRLIARGICGIGLFFAALFGVPISAEAAIGVQGAVEALIQGIFRDAK